jgi:hypothetical protein
VVAAQHATWRPRLVARAAKDEPVHRHAGHGGGRRLGALKRGQEGGQALDGGPGVPEAGTAAAQQAADSLEAMPASHVPRGRGQLPAIFPAAGSKHPPTARDAEHAGPRPNRLALRPSETLLSQPTAASAAARSPTCANMPDSTTKTPFACACHHSKQRKRAGVHLNMRNSSTSMKAIQVCRWPRCRHLRTARGLRGRGGAGARFGRVAV